MTKLHNVEAAIAGKRMSRIYDPTEDDPTLSVATAKKTCFWNGEEFAPGSMIRTPDGATYECFFGWWKREEE